MPELPPFPRHRYSGDGHRASGSRPPYPVAVLVGGAGDVVAIGVGDVVVVGVGDVVVVGVGDVVAVAVAVAVWVGDVDPYVAEYVLTG